MPFPALLARFNRRVTNRATGLVAGRAPGFGVIHHVGRKSGVAYRTPVNVFRRDGSYVIALTYGADSDWVKNVLAAGGCEIETGGRRLRLVAPRVIRDPQRRVAPLPVRLVLRSIRAEEFMELDVGEPR